MSTVQTHYAFYGLRLDYNAFCRWPQERASNVGIPSTPDEDDREVLVESYLEQFEDNIYDRYDPEPSDIKIVQDGMSGQYVYIGIILAKARGESGEGIPPTEMKPKPGWPKLKIASRIQEVLALKPVKPFKLGFHVFTHWS